MTGIRYRPASKTQPRQYVALVRDQEIGTKDADLGLMAAVNWFCELTGWKKKP